MIFNLKSIKLLSLQKHSSSQMPNRSNFPIKGPIPVHSQNITQIES